MFEQSIEMFEGVLSSAEFWDIVSLVSLGVLAITMVAIAVSVLKNRIRKWRGVEPVSIPATPEKSKPSKETSKTRRIFPSSKIAASEPQIDKEDVQKQEGSEIEILDVLEPEPEMAEKNVQSVGEPAGKILFSVSKEREKPSRPIIGSLSKDGKVSFGDKTLVQLTLPFGSVSVEGSTELAREIVDKMLVKAEKVGG
jgi:hypothetical protein